MTSDDHIIAKRWELLLPYLNEHGTLDTPGTHWGYYRVVWDDGLIQMMFASRRAVAAYVRYRTDEGDPPRYVVELHPPYEHRPWSTAWVPYDAMKL